MEWGRFYPNVTIPVGNRTLRQRQQRQQVNACVLNNTKTAGKITCDSELPDTRTEVLALRENLEPRASGVETLKGQVVATPAKFDTLLLQSKEGNQSANGNGAGEGGCSDAWERARSVQKRPTPADARESLTNYTWTTNRGIAF